MRKLKEKEIKELIDTIVIYIDTREKLPNHVTECFDKYEIKWERKRLCSGDYSAILPQNDKYNTPEINLEEELCVERKMSCDEIIQNLTKNKERFYREFERSCAEIPILIEDSFKNAATGKYRSKVTPNQFLGSLFSFCRENKTYFYFMDDKNYSALWIYDIFKYEIRKRLKNLVISENDPPRMA